MTDLLVVSLASWVQRALEKLNALEMSDYPSHVRSVTPWQAHRTRKNNVQTEMVAEIMNT